MKTRPLYDSFADDVRNTPLNAQGLLDPEDGLYDDNWIVSAGDLFGQLDLPSGDYNPFQQQAA